MSDDIEQVKSPDAFRTISEASDEIGVPPHVLRFWEGKFNHLRPLKRAGGRRFYRPQDMAVLRGLKALLQDDGYTIRGVQKLIKDSGIQSVRNRAMNIEISSIEIEDDTKITSSTIDNSIDKSGLPALNQLLLRLTQARNILDKALGS